MSKDDKKSMKRVWASAIRQNEKKLQRDHEIVTSYVQSANPERVNDSAVRKLIGLAEGKIVETIPHNDGSHQFKIEIQRRFLDSLKGEKDESHILNVSRKPFAAPSHSLRPRHQHKSQEPK